MDVESSKRCTAAAAENLPAPSQSPSAQGETGSIARDKPSWRRGQNGKHQPAKKPQSGAAVTRTLQKVSERLAHESATPKCTQTPKPKRRNHPNRHRQNHPLSRAGGEVYAEENEWLLAEVKRLRELLNRQQQPATQTAGGSPPPQSSQKKADNQASAGPTGSDSPSAQGSQQRSEVGGSTPTTHLQPSLQSASTSAKVDPEKPSRKRRKRGPRKRLAPRTPDFEGCSVCGCWCQHTEEGCPACECEEQPFVDAAEPPTPDAPEPMEVDPPAKSEVGVGTDPPEPADAGVEVGTDPIAPEATSWSDLVGEFEEWLHMKTQLMKRDAAFMKMLPALIQRWLKLKKIEHYPLDFTDCLTKAALERVKPSAVEIQAAELISDPDTRHEIEMLNGALKGEVASLSSETVEKWCDDHASRVYWNSFLPFFGFRKEGFFRVPLPGWNVYFLLLVPMVMFQWWHILSRGVPWDHDPVNIDVTWLFSTPLLAPIRAFLSWTPLLFVADGKCVLTLNFMTMFKWIVAKVWWCALVGSFRKGAYKLMYSSPLWVKAGFYRVGDSLRIFEPGNGKSQ
ncbi:MAG: hypothetical protein SToV4_gp1 [Sanya tombus-like virus 2]|nr:MAG: hypothetical protein SToV4_gp1 [Sanya tombus-like virus 2]